MKLEYSATFFSVTSAFHLIPALCFAFVCAFYWKLLYYHANQICQFLSRFPYPVSEIRILIFSSPTLIDLPP